MFCVWQWTIDDVSCILGRFESTTVTDQTSVYMDNNKNRDVGKEFKLRTTGAINVHLCSRMPFVIARAAETAHTVESENSNTTYGATLILVVFWEIFSDMRFVFWVLWKSQFIKPDDNSRPKLIEEMLRRGFRAMYIAYNLCSVLVCVLSYYFNI